MQFFCGHAVKAGKETQIFNDLEIVVERELLRHVADVLADGFGIAGHIESGNGARPEVGLSRPHSMRMVVDFPAPFGPRNPKTSPLRTVRLSRSTATKLPNRLTRFSITTEFAAGLQALDQAWLRSAGNRIDKQVFDGRHNLLNRVEGDLRVLQTRFEFRNAPRGVIDHHVHAIAGEHEARYSVSVFELRTQAARLRRRDRKNAFAKLDPSGSPACRKRAICPGA